MQAIVLAAGFGTRLSSVSRGFPKALVEVAGRALLAHVFESLALAGIDEVVVVTGLETSSIKSRIRSLTPPGMAIEMITNLHPEAGNGSSLLAAAPLIDGRPFVLAMGDHLAGPGIVRRLVREAYDGPPGGNLLAVDFNAWVPAQVADATRVLVDGSGRITRIGKQLEEFNGVDTGFFLLQPEVISIAELLCAGSSVFELTDLMRHLATTTPGLMSVDVSGELWLDIDGPNDLDFAADVFRLTACRPTSLSPLLDLPLVPATDGNGVHSSTFAG